MILDPLGPPSPSVVIIVMGVAGSGKTTIGGQLATELDCPFWDADSFHTESSVKKMSSGVPLTEDDRLPWLRHLREQVIDSNAGKRLAVLACSSLKASHRQILADGRSDVRFVYLRVSPELARARLQGRSAHFMGADLVDSQFADLEEPSDAIVVDGALDPPRIIEAILRGLNAPAVEAATAGKEQQETGALDAVTLASLRSVWSEVGASDAFDADRAVALVVNRLRHYEAGLWRVAETHDNLKALIEHRRAAGQEVSPADELRLDALRKTTQIAWLALSAPRWLARLEAPSERVGTPASDTPLP